MYIMFNYYYAQFYHRKVCSVISEGHTKLICTMEPILSELIGEEGCSDNEPYSQ